MIFGVLAVGTSSRDLGPFLRFISMNLVEANENGAEVSFRHQMQMELCTVLLFLLQLTPVVPGLMESFAQCCGGVQAGVGWILSVMVKSWDEKMIALGIRCAFSYLRSVTKSDDHPIALNITSVAQQQGDPNVVTTTETATSTTVVLASSTVASLAKGLASTMGPAGRAMVFSPSKLTPRVVYKLIW